MHLFCLKEKWLHEKGKGKVGRVQHAFKGFNHKVQDHNDGRLWWNKMDHNMITVKYVAVAHKIKFMDTGVALPAPGTVLVATMKLRH